MKNNVGKGAFVLVVSGIICKFFGGLFRLPLTNIVGMEGIGIFQMIMSIYSLALVFVSGGVTNALSKLISSARARGDNKIIGSYLRYGVIFSISFSLCISLFFLFFSKQIASIQGIAGGANSYLLGAFVGVMRGLIQGYSNMTPTAVSQIIEQVSKFAFGLVFAFWLGKDGIEKGVFGAFLGIVISEVLASIYLGWTSFHIGKLEFGKEGKKEFFNASLPLTFGGIVIPFSHAVESLFIITLLLKSGLTREVATSLYGLQTGVVGAILNFPLIISVAVAVSLLPNLSRLASTGETEGQRVLVRKSFLAMWYILLPLVVGIMSIAGELYPILYAGFVQKYMKIAIQLTLLSGISIILTAIMQFLISLLQANGYYSYSMIFSIIGGVGKLTFLFITAPLSEISIYSIALSNIVLALIVSICVLIKLGHLISLPFFDVVLPLLSVIIMYMVVKILLSVVGGYLGLFIAVVLGGGIYFVLSLPIAINYFKVIASRFLTKQEENT